MYKTFQHGDKTVEHVFSTMFYFMRHHSRDIQSESLNALGFVCVRHYNFMLEYKLKNLYIDILSKDFYPTQHKTQVILIAAKPCHKQYGNLHINHEVTNFHLKDTVYF